MSADLKWMHVFSINTACLDPDSNLSFWHAHSQSKLMFKIWILEVQPECTHNYLQARLNRNAYAIFILYLQFVQVESVIIVYKLIILTCFLPICEQYLLKDFKTFQWQHSDSAWFSTHCVDFFHVSWKMYLICFLVEYIHAVSLRNYYFVSGRSKLLSILWSDSKLQSQKKHFPMNSIVAFLRFDCDLSIPSLNMCILKPPRRK